MEIYIYFVYIYKNIYIYILYHNGIKYGIKGIKGQEIDICRQVCQSVDKETSTI